MYRLAALGAINFVSRADVAQAPLKPHRPAAARRVRIKYLRIHVLIVALKK